MKKNKSNNKDIIEGRWWKIKNNIKKKYLQNMTKLKIGLWIQKVIF